MKLRLPLLACVLTACTVPENTPEYPIIARILTSIDGRYQLANVKIETLTDVDHMSGTVGLIIGQAALNVDADVAEIMSSTDPDAVYSDRGHMVQTDYILEDGVVIPQNFQTMEMLGLYSVYERTVAFWVENFDIPFETIGLPSLYYNPRLRREKDGEAVEVSTTMNAAYLPGVRDFWFFKTASREHVPVKMNFGVVAHEFGHYIFDYQFARFDRGAYDTILAVNENFLSGLNEGLSDYFSYAVTQSVTEFGASLPELDQERRLPVSWTLRTSLSGVCTGSFYCQGSVLASALYEIAQLPGQTPLRVAQRAFRSLPDFRNNWLENRDNNLMDYSALLNAILTQAPEDQEAYCNIFRKWFDTDNVRLKLTCPT
ncbi:hypothetical protein [Oligoflexus tunisiensis]|uniref:hypothetical protein n=1 Tax=Oligoflexus tunisiensis TaxID=708132 RepID=UPI00114CB372|nr:hypothetical protein [Oligoflexus tunisiensis]